MPLEQDAALLQTKVAETRAFWDKVGDADLTQEQKQEIDGINKTVEELSAKVSESKKYQQIRAEQEALAAGLNAPVHTPDFGSKDLKGREPERETKSVGERFTDRKEFKEWFKSVAPSGEINETSSIGFSCPPLTLEGKALVTGSSAASGGALVRRDYAGLVDFPFRPMTLRDVITIGRTGSDLIEFPRVVSYTSAAATVAEATTAPTSFSQASNGLKPESSMVLEKVTATVKTIAHWIPLTRRALSDAPQIETLINNFLEFGLDDAEETQIVTGNGSGENFLGLDNTPNITLQAFDTDILTTTRKARTAAAVTGRARSTAFVMHPYDWEAFDLLKDAENRYYWGGPTVLGQKMLWGLPVVESEAMRLKTFYTGDLKQAILWDREMMTIRMSDAPNDFFLRNMLAILAERRAAFGVFRPPAIVRGDLLAGPNS